MHAHQSAPRPPVGREGRRRQGRALPGALAFATLCGVACLSLLAFGMRAIGFERVFEPDGTVVLAIDDAQYHARLARFSFEDFPRVLTWDPYLNFPHGARVPWPPLYDLALAGSARLLGEGPEALEHVLAWASVACAVLTALLLFPLARTLGSRAEALAAVAFFALLPASRFSSSVGNPDHHAVVALIATAICLLHAATLRGDAGPAAPWVLQGLAAIARVVLVLSWHGSILYIALGEGLLLAVAVGLGLERVVRAQAGGCALAGALAFLLLGPSGLAVSSWSPVEPSLLQPSALAVVALTGALWSWREGRAPASGAARRLVRIAGIGALSIIGLLLAGAGEGVASVWGYLGRGDAFIDRNFETQPLWSRPGAAADLYGLGVVVVALAPLGLLARARRAEQRGAALFLAGWLLVLLVLALGSARYANDLGPAASVAVAITVGGAIAWLARRAPVLSRLAPALTAIVVPLLLARPVAHLVPEASRSLATLSGREVRVERKAPGMTRTVYEFGRLVREATPETSGYDDPRERPEYGIIVPNTLGLFIKCAVRRPTPADNFGPYVGREGFALTRRFYASQSETAALNIASHLQARYVVTTDEGDYARGRMLHRLHTGDGKAGDGWRRLRHFRLVTEGPARGVPLGALTRRTPPFVDTPYKLFEVVAGAVLLVRGPVGTPVEASVEIATPTGRRFTYRARGEIGERGELRLRVPYATETDAPVRPTSAWRVRIGPDELLVPVRDDQVRSGAVIEVQAVAGVAARSPAPHSLTPPRRSPSPPRRSVPLQKPETPALFPPGAPRAPSGAVVQFG